MKWQHPPFAQVLIETYWNVNQNSTLSVLKLSEVLIETYWNVNR